MKTNWKKIKTNWKKIKTNWKKLKPPESCPTKDYGRTSPTQYVLYIKRWIWYRDLKYIY